MVLWYGSRAVIRFSQACCGEALLMWLWRSLGEGDSSEESVS
jgi:hypothetical protein